MPSIEETSAECEVQIINEEGLHMRPAMQIVDCANRFHSKITISKDTQAVDGKSIMQITMLAAGKGSRLKITAQGSDAKEAITALAGLFEKAATETQNK